MPYVKRVYDEKNFGSVKKSVAIFSKVSIELSTNPQPIKDIIYPF